MIRHVHNKVRTTTGYPLWSQLPVYVLLLLFNQGAVANTPISEFDLPKEISAANSIIIDSSGNVWFTEKVGKNLSMFNPQTGVFEVYPLPVSWGKIGPSKITFSPQGDIWFSVRRWVESDVETNMLGRFSLSEHTYHRYVLPPHTIPEELIVAADGIVWFLAPDENRLYKFEPASAALQDYVIPTRNAYARSISMDQKGNIWFAQANANQLASFNPDTAIFNEYPIPTRFANPGEITVDKEGKIWFVELTANRIGVFYPQRKRFDEAIIPTARSMPVAIKVDTHGNLWFLEYRGGKIGVFNPLDATFREYDIPAFNSQPGAMAIDHQRGILWFSESSTEVKKLGRLDINAALMAENQVTDSMANKPAADSSVTRSGYTVLLLLLALLLIITGVWYYRKGAVTK